MAAGGVLVLALLVLLALSVPAVQDAAMRAVIERRVTRDLGDQLTEDALHVLVCGSGSPLPAPDRAQACVAVFAGGRGYVFDIGTGSAENLATWRAPTERIERVFLTHFHSDHFGDLGELNLQGWVAGRGAALVVHGPPGVDRIVEGMDEAYALDRGYRVAHHGADLLPAPRGRLRAVSFEASEAPRVVHEAPGLEIRAFSVDHAPATPAVGYRIDYRGRSVVISGDTSRSAALTAAAENADLLLHEALAPHMVGAVERVASADGQDRLARVMGDIVDYHSSPVAAARVANEAGVGRLVLYHLVPGPPAGLPERIFLRNVSDVRDGVTLAADGSMYTLPTGSKEIIEGSP